MTLWLSRVVLAPTLTQNWVQKTTQKKSASDYRIQRFNFNDYFSAMKIRSQEKSADIPEKKRIQDEEKIKSPVDSARGKFKMRDHEIDSGKTRNSEERKARGSPSDVEEKGKSRISDERPKIRGTDDEVPKDSLVESLKKNVVKSVSVSNNIHVTGGGTSPGSNKKIHSRKNTQEKSPSKKSSDGIKVPKKKEEDEDSDFIDGITFNGLITKLIDAELCTFNAEFFSVNF